MSAGPPEVEGLVLLVNVLGGPKIQSKDIEWALDLPAGQSLIKWITSQAQAVVGESRASITEACKYIALEPDEIKMCVNGLSRFHVLM
jgi:hypothetical protein